MSLRIDAPKGYELQYETEIPDFAGFGQVFRHVKSGARICTIKNEDVNRTFAIAFRTTPSNSTGVPHIIEHSVLCGSDKFPLKDPFMELAKGSLNTYLNAMTYPDKTVYPIASCNLKDFRNLTDVYLDAVFHPAIYKHPEIFRQEGWRYELESEEGELTINGVVYNEMKGAFSNADDVLDRCIQQALYPDNTYGVESGGDPDVIPELSYEEFLDFHRTYYHPSNSYIYFYGDLDMEEQLTWLDREYLSGYDRIDPNSEVALQAPIGVKKVAIEYPIGEDEEEENNTYLTISAVMGQAVDYKRVTAWNVLNSVLTGTPGAPVKQALIDAGIGSDVSGGYASCFRQPCLTIMAKEADGTREEEFLRIVREECEKLVKEGIKKDTLLGILNSADFRYREQDSGSVSKGLYLYLEMLNSWLYDDKEAFGYTKLSQIYAELKSEIDTGYFEKVLQEDFLDSNHQVILRADPKKGLATKKEEELAEKLAAYKCSLSPEELTRLVADTKALRAFQEEEDSEEAKQCLPLLEISDIDPKTQPFFNAEDSIGDAKVVFHNRFTNGIAYLKLMFDLRNIPEEELLYLGFLIPAMGLMGTGKYSYQELADEMNIHTGGLDVISTGYSDAKDCRNFHPYLEATVRVLYDELPAGLDLLAEVVGTTDFSDTKRLRELLAMGATRMRSGIERGGHSAAVNRATSYFSEQGFFKQMTKGIAQYRFLKEMSEHFEERKDELVSHLETLCKNIFTPENLLLSLTCDEEGLALLKKEYPKMSAKLFRRGTEYRFTEPAAYKLRGENEAFSFAGQVQFLAACGNYKRAGLPYTGALRVAQNMLSSDYLWNQVRVKGGAYGCMCGFAAINGDVYLVSYRDPKLTETMKVYEGAGDYLRSTDLSEREKTKFIIGTIGEMDSPKTPRDEGDFAMNMYISGFTLEQLQKERDEVLQVTNEDLRACGAYLDAVISQGCHAAVGSESKLKSEGPELFTVIEPLG